MVKLCLPDFLDFTREFSMVKFYAIGPLKMLKGHLIHYSLINYVFLDNLLILWLQVQGDDRDDQARQVGPSNHPEGPGLH